MEISPATIVLIGVALSTAGAIISGIGAYQQNIKSSATSAQLKYATSFIQDTLTGGDGYLYLQMLQFPTTNTNQFALQGLVFGPTQGQFGKFPLTNLTLEVKQDGVVALTIPHFDAKPELVNNIGVFNIPQDKNFVQFFVSVYTTTGKHYGQYFMMKKNTDGTWYYHAIRLKDIYGFEVRDNEFQSGYPDQLKKMYIDADFYSKQIIQDLPPDVLQRIKAMHSP